MEEETNVSEEFEQDIIPLGRRLFSFYQPILGYRGAVCNEWYYYSNTDHFEAHVNGEEVLTVPRESVACIKRWCAGDIELTQIYDIDDAFKNGYQS